MEVICVFKKKTKEREMSKPKFCTQCGKELKKCSALLSLEHMKRRLVLIPLASHIPCKLPLVGYMNTLLLKNALFFHLRRKYRTVFLTIPSPCFISEYVSPFM